MPNGAELALRCRCGAVRGIARGVTPSSINHCYCYCDDCQAFAHFLGHPDDLLDAHGGTELAQMSQGNVSFTAGAGMIAVVRLAPKGLMRWYASCCNTPIGNTMATRALPFVGMIRAFVDSPPAALGPIRGRGWARSAKGGAAAVPKDGLPELIMVARVLAKLIRWRLRGDHRRSPLFDSLERPLAVPRVLTAAEREDLRQRCAAWRSSAALGGSA